MRGRLVASTIVAGIAVVAAGISFAAIPSADGTIHGCYKKTTRVLRVINAEAGQNCTSEERPLNMEPDRTRRPSGVLDRQRHRRPRGQLQRLSGWPHLPLFGGQLGNASSRCTQTVPADLELAKPHMQAFTVASHISASLLVNGILEPLNCELTTVDTSCNSLADVALNEGDSVALVVFDADGGNDGALDLRWTFEVQSPE